MPLSAFSSDYFEAREKFLEAVRAAGGEVESHLNPHTEGPGGEALFSDVATLGNPEAPNRVFMISATHGVEGFCGSGCQVAFLRGDIIKDRPDDFCFVLLHALNPHGFAWLRRVNENNVDLNRNFVDFDEALPVNPYYETLRSTMMLGDLSEESLRQANREMVVFGKEHGFDILQLGLTGGQYVEAEGLYYGGAAPTWSNALLRGIIRNHLQGARRVLQMDFHTGLGPNGYGEIITEYDAKAPEFELAKVWLGDDVTSTAAGDSSSAELTGTTDHAFHQEMDGAECVAAVLEYGTIASEDVFASTRADNWLHLNQPDAVAPGHAIKQQMRDAFYCETDEWKRQILERADQVLSRAISVMRK